LTSTLEGSGGRGDETLSDVSVAKTEDGVLAAQDSTEELEVARCERVEGSDATAVKPHGCAGTV
jgi:hypothetical protein